MASRKGPVYRKLQNVVAGEEEISIAAPTTSKRFYIICGIITAILVVVAIVAAAIAVTVVVIRNKKSEECADLTCMVKSRLDRSANPCEDFYQFACGGFDKSASKKYTTYSTFAQSLETTQNAIKNLLGSGFNSEGIPALQKVKDLYDSCMDTSAINARGVQPLRDIIRKTGGWSLVNIPNEEGQYPPWDISGTQFQMEKLLGSSAFFQISVGPDPEDSSRYILELVQSGLTWPAIQFYTDPTYGDAFEDVLEDTIKSMLQKLSSGAFENVAHRIVEFEERLAEIFVSISDSSDVEKSTNIMTIAELSSRYPYFNWVALFSAAGITSTTERINVLTPSYFSELGYKLHDTGSSTLENYAKWHFIRGFMPALDEESLTAFNLLKERATGKPANQDRYKSCIDIMEQVLPMALARSYAEHVFPDGVRENVTGMIEELKVALKERIDSQYWLDDYSSQRAEWKAGNLTQWVGYPDEIFNDAFLNELYGQYPISRSDYFNNFLQYVNISVRNNFAILHQPVNRTLFLAQAGTAPTQVNAFYYPPFNRIAILMGIMNAPFFQLGWPNYYLFGALGGAIGHEMVHGFDNAGRQYDPEGNVNQWWSDSSISEYKNRQECFVTQYSMYEKFGRSVNGRQTLGENIADNGGMKASFQAYKNFVYSNGPETSLSGLEDYTPEQMFFVAWAQDWCTFYSDDSSGELYFTISLWSDVHSPGLFRVTGPLVNNPDFAQAFNCPAGSRMNPTNKCLLW